MPLLPILWAAGGIAFLTCLSIFALICAFICAYMLTGLPVEAFSDWLAIEFFQFCVVIVCMFGCVVRWTLVLVEASSL